MNERGVVTVFLAVVLPVVLISCILLTDAAVLRTGCDISEDALTSAAYSVLGKYSSYLYEKYEIYGFDSTVCNEQYISDILKDNLRYPGFYDFSIEGLDVKYEGCLADPGELEKAVLSVSGDDLYQNLIEEFLDRFNILEGFRGYAEILKLKMQVDEAVRKFREAGEILDKLINGNDDISIDGIDFPGSFAEDIREIESMLVEMRRLAGQVDELRRVVEDSESEEAGQLRLLEEARGVLMEKISMIYSNGLGTVVSGLSTACKEALACLRTMVEEKGRLNIFSRSIKDLIEKSDGLPGYMKEILLSVSDVIEDVENEAVGIVFDEIGDKIEGNLGILLSASDTVETSIDEGVVPDNKSVMDVLSGYDADICYEFAGSGTAGKGDDRRGFFEELGRRVLEKRTGKDIEIDKGYILPSESYESTGKNPEFNVTSTGTDTKSAESAMDEFEGDGRVIGSFLDSLSVNEYLLNHLSYETSEVESAGFFKNEIEYVLWGARSQNLNRFYTKSALMGTRFALNAIHVYTDSRKKLKADAIAAATAGWWTAGAGIPVMSNLVKCSWAIAESGVDVKNLCNGNSVAIFKRKADWVTDIGIKPEGMKTPEFMRMDYEDYMRLYLMMGGIEKRMSGLSDIIQLNSANGFDIRDTYSKIHIEAVISFRSMTGKRHEKTFEVSLGYQGGNIG